MLKWSAFSLNILLGIVGYLFVTPVFAQTGGSLDSSGGNSTRPPATVSPDSTGASDSSGAAVSTSTDPGAGTGASAPATSTTPSSTLFISPTPNSTSTGAGSVLTTPVAPPPTTSLPIQFAPAVSISPSGVSTDENEVEAPSGNISPAIVVGIVGVVLTTALGLLFAGRAKKKTANSDPCGVMKKRFEQSQMAYDVVTKKLTLQEMLVLQLEREIGDAKEALKEKVRGHAEDVARNIATQILENEKSGVLKKVSHLATDVKDTYDHLAKRYRQAKELLLILKKRHEGLADEVREREALFQLCREGVNRSATASRGGKIITLPTPEVVEKTILVDAIYVFVDEEGIFKELFDLLETYKKRKILLTRANEAQWKKFGLEMMPYEVFTRKHHPEKSDPTYYELLLKHFGLTSSDVIYFEHDAPAVQSAESVGIATHHYDSEKKDLVALKKFLDTNLR